MTYQTYLGMGIALEYFNKSSIDKGYQVIDFMIPDQGYWWGTAAKHDKNHPAGPLLCSECCVLRSQEVSWQGKIYTAH